MAHNPIITLGSGGFAGLSAVTSLCVARQQLLLLLTRACARRRRDSALGYNQITAIGTGAFSGLSSLTTLCVAAVAAAAACRCRV
jgi:hypothetical protein